MEDGSKRAIVNEDTIKKEGEPQQGPKMGPCEIQGCSFEAQKTVEGRLLCGLHSYEEENAGEPVGGPKTEKNDVLEGSADWRANLEKELQVQRDGLTPICRECGSTEKHCICERFSPRYFASNEREKMNVEPVGAPDILSAAAIGAMVAGPCRWCEKPAVEVVFHSGYCAKHAKDARDATKMPRRTGPMDSRCPLCGKECRPLGSEIDGNWECHQGCGAEFCSSDLWKLQNDEDEFLAGAGAMLDAPEKAAGEQPKAESSGVNHCSAMTPLTWRQRIGRFLFPCRNYILPEEPVKLLGGTEPVDVLVCRTFVSFCWLDRFRILISGRAICETRTYTENAVGKNTTLSVVNVFPPAMLDQDER